MSFFLIPLIYSISFILIAGAPAPKDALPQPPYIFKNGNLLSVEVQWNRASIKSFLPEDFAAKESITGGINVYLTKSNRPLSKLSYTVAWIDNHNGNKEIFLGFFGPNDDGNRLINNISKINGELGKNKMMLLNNKISARLTSPRSITFKIS